MVESRPILIRRMAGFTLIEAVMAIVITGILAAVVAVFLQKPVEGYFDSARRAELTDAADAALRRIARDVRMALPNSLRGPSSSANTQCIEFIPVIGGGRYRHQTDAAGVGEVFDDKEAAAAGGAFVFDVLAETGVAGTAKGNFVVVNNTRDVDGLEAYQAANLAGTSANKRAIAAVPSAPAAPNLAVLTVSLDAGLRFTKPLPPKGFHFQVIPPYTVIYSCPGAGDRNLYRTTRALVAATSLAPLPSCPTSGTVLVSNVTSCSLTYVNDLLMMTLEIADPATPTETIRLFNEVQVNNAP